MVAAVAMVAVDVCQLGQTDSLGQFECNERIGNLEIVQLMTSSQVGGMRGTAGGTGWSFESFSGSTAHDSAGAPSPTCAGRP